jgi:Tfp pilus assembly protein PilE
MRISAKQSGLTITEVLTTVVIIVVLTLVSLPAIDSFFDSMSSTGSAEAMINAALSNARAMAISKQRYVGVRFQLAYNNSDPNNPFAADQYMIFIMSDYQSTNLASGFIALDGMKPMKLPESLAAMEIVADDSEIEDIDKVNDKTTFSIVFSPSGAMLLHDVRVVGQNVNDSVFNDMPNSKAMFQQDTDVTPPFKKELSCRSFRIYDTKEFKRAYDAGQPYSGYLQGLKPVYINPYTGTVISSD